MSATIAPESARAPVRSPLEVAWLRRVDYREAWELQRRLAAERAK